MKISIMIIQIILCLMAMMFMAGCSSSHNRILTLWEERQMDDDRRIYGNPYESSNRQHYFRFNATSWNLLVFSPNPVPQPAGDNEFYETSTMRIISANY